mmetsp:Transcript_100157/g.161480  ORF Transcript_100157/g.161480 Transcript_100157/m.161480 type:complete len:167 (+) Transcript_100157:92-592(+)
MPEGAKMNTQKGGAVDPFSYPDKTDRGQTEAHRELGRDKQSFMFEQVRSVWIARNWCSVLAATIGMIGPPVVEQPVTSWMRALGFAPFLFGGTLGVALAFAAAWFALEILRRIDDAMGSFSEEELQDRRAVSLGLVAWPACPAWTFSIIGLAIMQAIHTTQGEFNR